MNRDPIEKELRDTLTPDSDQIDNIVDHVMSRIPENQSRRRLPLAWVAVLVICLGLAILLQSLKSGQIVIPDLLPLAHAATAGPVIRAEVGWDDDKDEPIFMPLEMITCDIAIRTTGAFAETSMTLTFRNNHDQEIEGDFVFPLPPGAVATGYALDIKGELREGVVVSKQRARQVFENLVERNIDPGILEYLQGNKFRTRIFPFEEQGGTRTVRVDFIQQLTADRQDDIYRLPMTIDEKVPNATLRVEVAGDVQPTALPGLAGKLTFKQQETASVAQLDLSGRALTGEIGFKVPAPNEPQIDVEQGPDGWFYFCQRRAVDLPENSSFERPNHIVVYWDSSGSRAESDIDAEFNVLRRLMAHWDNTTTVDLYRVRHIVEPVISIECPNGDAMPLVHELRRTIYDGGSSLRAVLDHDPQHDIPTFVFTDGQSNVDRGEDLSTTRALTFISSGNDVNTALMQHVGSTSGGTHVHLSRELLADTAEALAMPTVRAHWSGLSGGAVYPQPDSRVDANTSFVGRVPKLADALLTLQGAHSTQKRTIRLASSSHQRGTLLMKIYGRRRIASLMARPIANAAELTAVGIAFGMVTPGTSMLVLETIDQYLDYKIVPPDSEPGMKNKYARLIESHEASWRARELDREDIREEALAYCREIMESHLEWHSTEYNLPADYKVNDYGLVANLTAGYSLGGMVATMDKDAEISLAGAEEGGGITIEESSSESDGDENSGAGSSEPILPWNPNSPYLKKLRDSDDAYATYLQLKKIHSETPSFHLDCGEFFLAADQRDIAYRCFFNVAESGHDRVEFLRVLANKFKQNGDHANSVTFFKKILDMRPRVSRSHMELALALEESGENILQAIAHVEKILTENFNDFDDEHTRTLAVKEYGRLLAKAKHLGHSPTAVDPMLATVLDSDIRVVLRWDMSQTDIDLWVCEPTGERCWYQNDETALGGILPMDVTFGDGPEEYALRVARDGIYTIAMEYWGSYSSKAMGPVTIFIDAYTNWGRPNEKKRTFGLRLEGAGDIFKLAEIEFKNGTSVIRPIVDKPLTTDGNLVRRKFHSNGMLSQEQPVVDGQVTGTVKNYNYDRKVSSDGSKQLFSYLESTIEAANGKQHGWSRYFDPDGILVSEEFYKEGVASGLWKSWFTGTDGKRYLGTETNYVDGLQRGLYSTYTLSINGSHALLYQSDYLENDKSIVRNYYDPALLDGRTQAHFESTVTKDSTLDQWYSVDKTYNIDGSLLSQSHVAGNITANCFDNNGVLHSRWKHKNNITEVKFFDLNDEVIATAHCPTRSTRQIEAAPLMFNGALKFPITTADRTVTIRHPSDASLDWLQADVRDGRFHGTVIVKGHQNLYTKVRPRMEARFERGQLHGWVRGNNLQARFEHGQLVEGTYKLRGKGWFAEGYLQGKLRIKRVPQQPGQSTAPAYDLIVGKTPVRLIKAHTAAQSNSVIRQMTGLFDRFLGDLNLRYNWKRSH